MSSEFSQREETERPLSDEKPLSLKNIICTACGESLRPELDKAGESLEWLCKKEGCSEQGVIVRRTGHTTADSAPVERFGRTPTNRIEFGEGLGSFGRGTESHQILNRTVNENNRFDISTQEGRFALNERKRQLSASMNPETENDTKLALEIFSNWNKSLPSCVKLSKELVDAVASKIRANVRNERKRCSHRVKRKQLVNIINAILLVNGSLTIGESISLGKSEQVIANVMA